MNELTINKDKLAEVYQNASAETREALIALFGDESNFIDKSKTTLDGYTTIKTYEDACEALGMVPMLNQSDYELTDESNFIDKSKTTLDGYTTIKTYEDACEALGMVPMLNQSDYELTDDNGCMVYFPPHIIALMKLETISRALWGRTWKPEPDADGSTQFYFPVFALYTKSEIDNMDEDERGGLLSACANSGAIEGYGCLGTTYRSSSADAYSGFRLCQETREKALYFGKQFLSFLVCGCVQWVPLVPRNKGKSFVFRQAVH